MTVLSIGWMFGATAAKGVFSVAADKTVQFANANSVYSANDLIQWGNLDVVKEAGWDVLTGDEWSYLLASGRTNANDLNALGTVNGTKGLIILPDEWVQLRFYSPDLKRIFEATETIPYSNDTNKGTIADPYTPEWTVAK